MLIKLILLGADIQVPYNKLSLGSGRGLGAGDGKGKSEYVFSSEPAKYSGHGGLDIGIRKGCGKGRGIGRGEGRKRGQGRGLGPGQGLGDEGYAAKTDTTRCQYLYL